MKRTPLKRSKKPIKANSKQSVAKLQRSIWVHCKRLVRAKYGNVCYTCGRKGLEGSNWHTGHLWPKAALSAYLKYDLRVLRPQCYHCNINLGGNGAVFYVKMLSEIGSEAMSRLVLDKQVTVKAHDFYIQLLEKLSTV